MKKTGLAVLVFVAVCLLAACNGTALPQSSSSAVSSGVPAAPTQIPSSIVSVGNGKLPVGTLLKISGMDTITGYTWLTTQQLVVETSRENDSYVTGQSGLPLTTGWFTWALGTGEFAPLYEFDTTGTRAIAAAKLEDGRAQLTLQGGNRYAFDFSAATPNLITVVSHEQDDPQRAYCDLPTGNLFFEQDGTLQWDTGNGLFSLYSFTGQSTPTSFAVSPDSMTLAFVVTGENKTAQKVVLVDLPSHHTTELPAPAAAPQLFWLGNHLMAVANVETGGAVLYYGDRLADKLPVQFEGEQGTLAFADGKSNLGAILGKLPLVKRSIGDSGTHLSQLCLLSTDTGGRPVLTEEYTLKGGSIRCPALSPDGKTLVFNYSTDLAGENETVYILPITKP